MENRLLCDKKESWDLSWLFFDCMKKKSIILKTDKKRIGDDVMIKVENGMVGEGTGFRRIRRITGYLVGTIDRFNDAKKAEVRDRVNHSTRS